MTWGGGPPVALAAAGVTTSLLSLSLQFADESGFPVQSVLPAYPEKYLGVGQYSELGSVALGEQRELPPETGR